MATTTLFEIPRPDLPSTSESSGAYITGVKHLASYNWIEALTPTIVIPGSPPAWSNIKYPKQLQKDSGLVFIDQNTARLPQSPLEPLFRALYVENPEFDLRDVDIISDRNNIRKLLSFVDPATSRNGAETFTIRVESANNTVLLSRHDALIQEVIRQDQFGGFGHEFEKAYTSTQIPGSTGHHRVISYDFNGLKFLIRHETDGYIDDHDSQGSVSAESDILEKMQTLSINSAGINSPSTTPGSKLTIKKAGREMLLESTLEIKIRVSHKPLLMDEVIPQLWVSQTPKLVRAYHTRGVFNPPTVEDVKAVVNSWEQRNQITLIAFGAVMKKISNAARCYGQITIRYQTGADTLTISQTDGARMLPDDLYHMWETVKLTKDGSSATANIDKEDARCPPINVEPATKSDATTIRVGDDLHNILLHKFPYLQTFVKASCVDSSVGTQIYHPAVQLFDVAVKGVMTGYRQCFRLLNSNADLFQELCDTYNFLEVDVLEGQSLNDIAMNVKAGKADFDSDGRGDKRLARDQLSGLFTTCCVGRLIVPEERGTKSITPCYMLSRTLERLERGSAASFALFATDSSSSPRSRTQVWTNGDQATLPAMTTAQLHRATMTISIPLTITGIVRTERPSYRCFSGLHCNGAFQLVLSFGSNKERVATFVVNSLAILRECLHYMNLTSIIN